MFMLIAMNSTIWNYVHLIHTTAKRHFLTQPSNDSLSLPLYKQT